MLPECFVPLYQSNAWAHGASRFGGWDELWERLWENSVDVPGRSSIASSTRCREHDVWCAIGVNEREPERPGNALQLPALHRPRRSRHRHRKLMPTHHERLFHGIGSGDDLTVVDTPVGRARRPDLLGEPDAAGPLCDLQAGARRSGSRRRPTTATAGWRRCATSRSSRARSWSPCRSTSRPRPSRTTSRSRSPRARTSSGSGGAAIVEPQAGEVIAGPLYGEEGIVIADCDLRCGAARRSAGSTPSGTTAGRTCWPRWRRRSHHRPSTMDSGRLRHPRRISPAESSEHAWTGVQAPGLRVAGQARVAGAATWRAHSQPPL